MIINDNKSKVNPVQRTRLRAGGSAEHCWAVHGESHNTNYNVKCFKQCTGKCSALYLYLYRSALYLYLYIGTLSVQCTLVQCTDSVPMYSACAVQCTVCAV